MNLTQQFVNAIWLGGVYSLFSLGYALVFSILGILNLAHSAVFMWGAFIGLTVVLRLNVSVWLSIPVAMLGAGVIGVLLLAAWDIPRALPAAFHGRLTSLAKRLPANQRAKWGRMIP